MSRRRAGSQQGQGRATCDDWAEPSPWSKRYQLSVSLQSGTVLTDIFMNCIRFNFTNKITKIFSFNYLIQILIMDKRQATLQKDEAEARSIDEMRNLSLSNMAKCLLIILQERCRPCLPDANCLSLSGHPGPADLWAPTLPRHNGLFPRCWVAPLAHCSYSEKRTQELTTTTLYSDNIPHIYRSECDKNAPMVSSSDGQCPARLYLSDVRCDITL